MSLNAKHRANAEAYCSRHLQRRDRKRNGSVSVKFTVQVFRLRTLECYIENRQQEFLSLGGSGAT